MSIEMQINEHNCIQKNTQNNIPLPAAMLKGSYVHHISDQSCVPKYQPNTGNKQNESQIA